VKKEEGAVKPKREGGKSLPGCARKEKNWEGKRGRVEKGATQGG